jgi:hypothetical protein
VTAPGRRPAIGAGSPIELLTSPAALAVTLSDGPLAGLLAMVHRLVAELG